MIILLLSNFGNALKDKAQGQHEKIIKISQHILQFFWFWFYFLKFTSKPQESMSNKMSFSEAKLKSSYHIRFFFKTNFYTLCQKVLKSNDSNNSPVCIILRKGIYQPYKILCLDTGCLHPCSKNTHASCVDSPAIKRSKCIYLISIPSSNNTETC